MNPYARMKSAMASLWKAGYAAWLSFSGDDGWAIASHIALSGIMALFPFLIFCTSLAAFFNLGDFPETIVHIIFEGWPPPVADPLEVQVKKVLTQPRGDVLTFGAALALYFSSNGVEALRLGLNRAYRVKQRRGIIISRLQSIFFVLISAVMLATVVFLLLLLPLAMAIAGRYLPWIGDYAATIGFWRIAVSLAILMAALVASHKWLPAGKRTFSQIMPGILVTLTVWFLASIAFSIYLRSFANYVSTYAGLAGIMMALVFFYMMSVIFLLGAEINAALAAQSDKPVPQKSTS